MLITSADPRKTKTRPEGAAPIRARRRRLLHVFRELQKLGRREHPLRDPRGIGALAAVANRFTQLSHACLLRGLTFGAAALCRWSEVVFQVIRPVIGPSARAREILSAAGSADGSDKENE